MIPYGRQYIDQDDINAVVETLKSDYLTTGSKVQEFEQKFANYVGSKYAVSVSSGTAALHLAMLASNIKSDDEVITTPMSFSATANCIEYVGGITVLADIDEITCNINPDEIKNKITNKTKAIIPVHYAGLPCNMERIYEIAKNNNLIVVEDAAHALGACYRGSTIGDCEYSDMTTFSFHPVKHITTGEGGCITTNSEELYNKLLKFRNHGMKRDINWLYDIKDLGFNYRLTDFQCALGTSQLDKLDSFLGKRRNIAYTYNEEFENLSIELPYDNIELYYHPYHLYVVRFKNSNIRKYVYDKLKERGILAQVHYISIHTLSYYKDKYGYKWGDYPNAENHYSKCLSLPIYPAMTDGDINYVINSVKEILTDENYNNLPSKNDFNETSR
jgi:UDP-4-amino-4,6-dideoxy-N-acetyl-beta-L-altrosamine transaminase